MVKSRHFKSKEGYEKFVAFEHMHDLEKPKKHYPTTFIGGKVHKVNHSRKKK